MSWLKEILLTNCGNQQPLTFVQIDQNFFTDSFIGTFLEGETKEIHKPIFFCITLIQVQRRKNRGGHWGHVPVHFWGQKYLKCPFLSWISYRQGAPAYGPPPHFSKRPPLLPRCNNYDKKVIEPKLENWQCYSEFQFSPKKIKTHLCPNVQGPKMQRGPQNDEGEPKKRKLYHWTTLSDLKVWITIYFS